MDSNIGIANLLIGLRVMGLRLDVLARSGFFQVGLEGREKFVRHFAHCSIYQSATHLCELTANVCFDLIAQLRGFVRHRSEFDPSLSLAKTSCTTFNTAVNF